MARIPMTAREQLERAHEFGHDLTVEPRGEGGFIVCSCGYRSTRRMTRATLNSAMAWHLGKAIAEGLDTVNGR